MMKRAAITGLAALFLSGAAWAEGVSGAQFAEPTARYDHGILGDEIEYGALRIYREAGGSILVRLGADHVFEDLEPRLVDVNNDGDDEVVVIETDVRRGAALAIYDETGKIGETPHIGRTHRWLAPIGAADLDGDGQIEIAYIDRPHLARLMRVWRYQEGEMVLVAELPGLTNHRIGQDFISGGIRDCGDGPEMITANADWSQIMATTLSASGLSTRAIAPFTPGNMNNALICDI